MRRGPSSSDRLPSFLRAASRGQVGQTGGRGGARRAFFGVLRLLQLWNWHCGSGTFANMCRKPSPSGALPLSGGVKRVACCCQVGSREPLVAVRWGEVGHLSVSGGVKWVTCRCQVGSSGSPVAVRWEQVGHVSLSGGVKRATCHWVKRATCRCQVGSGGRRMRRGPSSSDRLPSVRWSEVVTCGPLAVVRWVKLVGEEVPAERFSERCACCN